jgi:valyl-tRNA synthetase
VDHAERPQESAVAVLTDAEIILPLEGLIDREAETARHKKALGDIDKQLASVRAKLGNEGFVARAKPEVVEQQRAKEAELVAQQASLASLLGNG